MSESYAAASFLLRNSCIDNVEQFLDDTGQRIRFDLLAVERHWSDGEFVIIEAAEAMYNGRRGCDLCKTLECLDNNHFALFIEALQMRRPAAFTTNLVGGGLL
jgi:hypothetical protein